MLCVTLFLAPPNGCRQCDGRWDQEFHLGLGELFNNCIISSVFKGQAEGATSSG